METPASLEAVVAEQPSDANLQDLAASPSAAAALAPGSDQPFDSGAAETRAIGHVTVAVYAFYIGGMGIAVSVVIAASLLLMQASSVGSCSSIMSRSGISVVPCHIAITSACCFLQASRTGSDLWLAWAAAHPVTTPEDAGPAAVSTKQFLQGLMGFAAASVACALVCWWSATVLVPYDAMHPVVRAVCVAGQATAVPLQVRAFSFAYAGLVAARHLHARLLAAVLASPCAFFEQTPAGMGCTPADV